MKNKPESNKSSKNGFTLVEIMVSVAIIGILSAVIFPSFLGARAKARDTKRISDMKQIQVALEVYFDKCGVYPTPVTTSFSTDRWGVNGGTPISVIDDRVLDVVNSACPQGVTLRSFISKIPNPPDSPNSTLFHNYRYAIDRVDVYTPRGQRYHLSTRLETNNSALQDKAGKNTYGDPNYGPGASGLGIIPYVDFLIYTQQGLPPISLGIWALNPLDFDIYSE